MSMKAILRLEGRLVWGDNESAPENTQDEMKRYIDGVMTELVRLTHVNNNVSDPSVFGSFRDQTVDVTISVQVEDPIDAHAMGSGIIRSAFHSAGVRTPDWSVHWVKVEAEVGYSEDDDALLVPA